MPQIDYNDSSEHTGVDDEGNITVPPLLPIPSMLAKPGDRLCDVCKALNLIPRRFVILHSEKGLWIKLSDPDIRLGHIKDMREKTYCPLCRLVLSSLGGNGVPNVQDRRRVKVKMSWYSDGLTRGAYPVPRYKPVIRVLQLNAYTGKGKDRSSVHIPTSPFPRITMLANDAPTPSKTGLIRMIGDQIDFSIVLNAFRLCKKWHGSACNKSEKFHAQFEDPAIHIPHFRLIDTKDNCVVLPPKGCRYVTLSYVWGKINTQTILRLLKANVAELAKPGSLLLPGYRNRIPLTIRDAMEVVRRLNLRYLWVDSLCIVQDDDGHGGSKLSAISKMDLVYGGAYVTIVAATGIDANAGLPGVWPGTRGPAATRLIEELYPGLRLAYMETMGDDAEKTVYFDRAWTFQEQQLASRSLVFSSGQVVFKCQRNTSGWREDVVFEDALQRVQEDSGDDKDADSKDGSRNDKSARDDDEEDEDDSGDDEDSNDDEDGTDEDEGEGDDNTDINDFTDLLIGYSGLSLTYDSDIYHAFAGMNRHFKEELLADLCHGIPNAYFDWFLLWIPDKVPTRRAIAPSWSWSGWIGRISVDLITHTYLHGLSKIRKSMRRHTWIIWYHRRAHDSEECILVGKTSRSESSPPTNFYGGRVQARFPFDCTQTVPTPRKMVGAPTYVEDSNNPSSPGSGFLQFWTVSAIFKLDKASGKVDQDQDRDSSGLVHVGIYGRDGRQLGLVSLDPKWAETNVPKTHEFILLCEGRGITSHDDDDDEDDDGWKYIVMLLERHGDWAERVSLGKIQKDDLVQALGQGPVWKEIILG